MKKTLPDEGFYFMMISLETEETQRRKCHLQLHLGLGKLSLGLIGTGATLFLKAEPKEKGRRGGKEGRGRGGRWGGRGKSGGRG